MFWSHTYKVKNCLKTKPDISEVINIYITEDMENTPPESRWFHMIFMSDVFSSETLMFI